MRISDLSSDVCSSDLLTATIIGKTRLQTIPEFENILLKFNPDGSQVRLRDVSEISLGAENFAISSGYNGSASSGMALRLASGGNLLETVERVEVVGRAVRGERVGQFV